MAGFKKNICDVIGKDCAGIVMEYIAPNREQMKAIYDRNVRNIKDSYRKLLTVDTCTYCDVYRDLDLDDNCECNHGVAKFRAWLLYDNLEAIFVHHPSRKIKCYDPKCQYCEY